MKARPGQGSLFGEAVPAVVPVLVAARPAPVRSVRPNVGINKPGTDGEGKPWPWLVVSVVGEYRGILQGFDRREDAEVDAAARNAKERPTATPRWVVQAGPARGPRAVRAEAWPRAVRDETEGEK